MGSGEPPAGPAALTKRLINLRGITGAVERHPDLDPGSRARWGTPCVVWDPGPGGAACTSLCLTSTASFRGRHVLRPSLL